MPWSAAAILGSALIGAKGQKRANQETEASTAKQMAFQERMSNTAYKRGMTDMRAAGLNPILAGKLGGASSPGGSSYQAGNVGAAGVAAAQQAANVELTKANIDKTIAETDVLTDTDGSFFGKTVEYFKKEGLNLYKTAKHFLSNNEAIKYTVDQLVKQNVDVKTSSAKQLIQLKEKLNKLVHEAVTRPKVKKHVVTRSGLKPMLTKKEAREYVIGEIN